MKKMNWCLVVGLNLVLLAGCCGVKTKGLQQNKTAIPKKPYHCLFTAEPIKVDGILDEPAWEKANVLNFFIPATFKEPISKTEARVLYDNKYLYVGFKAYDQDVWGFLTERDTYTCTEDVLEVFIKTDPQLHPDGPDPYFNFEINPLGTVLDAFNVKRGAAGNYKRWSDWNCEGLKIAAQVKGTFNDWRDKDEYWTLEVAIPFTSLPTLSGRSPQRGDIWLLNLARYDYSVYLPKGCELTSCAPLSKVDYHLHEDFLKLTFQK
ncbi:MAG: carbohydrate-binding family 9-like protein [Candidatus Omnitrophota bacterium]